MNRLNQTFAVAKAADQKLLCPFLTAGYPSLEITPDLLLAAQVTGAGVIELGIPFSDPVADGPVIQESFSRALAAGLTVDKALAAVSIARKKGVIVPVVAMVSFSIIFKRGTAEFAKACHDHGIDAIILPDVPLEEASAIVEIIAHAGLRSCLLVAPSSSAKRREEIARLCDGFVYYLSVAGITGERNALPPDLAANIAALRKVTPSPICVGFGISTAEQVREVTRQADADGAIVGSALVRRLTQTFNDSADKQLAAAASFIAELAKGLEK
ncbi:MAG: tryptophan synthase subunit alpha [Phycisphaerales bacterium]|nr:tryptophan synthase subunit alpha [Phycisphaerales bacterium]